MSQLDCALLPLAAADVDLLIGIVIGIITVLSYVVKFIGRQARPKVPPVARPMAGDAGGVPFDPVKEVQDFLRRIQSGQTGESSSPTMVRPEPERQAKRESQPKRRQRGGKNRRSPEVPTMVSPSSPPPVPRRSPAAPTVTQRALRSSISDEIPSGVDVSEAALEAHMKQTFAHQLGSLGAEVAAPDDLRDSEQAGASTDWSAASLAAMMRTPEGMRQVIALSTILERPESRWD